MKPPHGLQEPEAQAHWVLHSTGFATRRGCSPCTLALALNASLAIFPSHPAAELPELRQGRVWATVPAVAVGSATVYRKPISQGMIGVELAACLCGLAVTVAGPEKEGRGSHFKEGGASSELGKEQC